MFFPVARLPVHCQMAGPGDCVRVVGYPHLGIISELPVDRQVGILLLMQPDHEVISVWRDSARFWEKHREIIRQMFAPVTQALVEDGLIGSRHVVLDIATGPGEPALTIAALVGPEARSSGSITYLRW